MVESEEGKPEPTIENIPLSDDESKNKSKTDPLTKRKQIGRKINQIVAEITPYYYTLIPLFIALIILYYIYSQEKIPGLTSSLFDPGFKIGLDLVILSSLFGTLVLILSEQKFKKLQKIVDKMQSDLYEKKSNTTLQKISKSPNDVKSFLEHFPFNLIKDFTNWLHNREIATKDRTVAYLLLIFIVVFFIQILGMNLAENTAPHAQNLKYTSTDDPNFKLKNMIINYNITNIDNTRFDLMQPTERLYANFTITNNYSTEVIVKYNERSFLGGSFIENLSIDDQKIPPNKTVIFYRILYLKDAGINTFYFDFTVHNATSTKYGYLTDDSILGKETIQRPLRVYSSDDYNYRTNQYLVYYSLGLVSLPLILIGVRAFKEIIEDEKENSEEYKIYR